MKGLVIVFIFCFMRFTTLGQSIEAINYMLDSVVHSKHIRFFHYREEKQLPDSVKKKMLAVLNGYLPPQRIAQANKFSISELQTITKSAKTKCKGDTDCVKKTKELIKQQYIIDRLEGARMSEFATGFILALASWDVVEAKEILWRNRTQTSTFPEVETYMALARFGYTEALDSLLKWIFVDVNCKDAQNYADDYIRRSISDLLDLAIYLKNKEFYLRMVDLFDIEEYGYSDFSPDEDRYPTEYIVLSNITDHLYRFKNNDSVADAEWNDLQSKWEKYMPSLSDEGLRYINRLCERRVILDVNHETMQTVEQLCSEDISDIRLGPLIEVIQDRCTDELSTSDLYHYVKLKRFRQSGLKQQMKSEIRSWIDKYVVF